MSKTWEKSNLEYGEELRIPDSLMISTEAKLISAVFVGETDSGVMIDCTFRPSFRATGIPHYRMMINWASMWCGHVKLFRKNGEQIFARRVKGSPVDIGQYRGGYDFKGGEA